MANSDGDPGIFKRRKETGKNHSKSADGSFFHRCIVHVCRVCFLLTALICIIYKDNIQYFIDNLWATLLQTWVYNSVYFETWCATLCYALVTLLPLTMHLIPWFDSYKINPAVTYTHTTVISMILDAIVYNSPLMILDTVKIKRYPGVVQEDFTEREQYWLQTTRPLPVQPPSFYQLVFQLVVSVLLFDALFFVFHYCCHRNRLLYKYIHRFHHTHDVIYCHVTNQLSIPERLALILSANEALKICSSHPLTRTLFIPVFMFILVDNHSGYDVPWGLQRVIPFGLYGGPVKHYFHHELGSKHYQPFLCYIDKFLDREVNNNERNLLKEDCKEL